MKNATRILLPLVLLLATATAHASGVRVIDERRPASSEVRLEVETVPGSVTIEAWDRNEVEVKGSVRDDAEFSFTGSEGSLRIEVKWPKKAFGGLRLDQEDCRLEIKAPAGAALSVSTVSADITIRGNRGKIKAGSVSGDLVIAGEPRAIELESVSGDIDLTSNCREVSIESVSGDIEAAIGGGEARVETVSGEITVAGELFESVRMESVSGDVEWSGALMAQARVEISAHSGDVELRLRGEPSARISVSTFSGSIESDFGGRAERTSRHAPGEEYETTVGAGSAEVTIEAFSGSVTLRRI